MPNLCSPYEAIKAIKEGLNAIDRIDINPYLVEAYLLLKYGRLDSLDRKTFLEETKEIVKEIDSSPELTDTY